MIYYDAWNEHAGNDEADAKASKEYAKGSGRTAKNSSLHPGKLVNPG